MSTSVLDSLLVALGYEFDDKGLQEFEKSVDDVTGKINGLIAGIVATATAFVAGTIATANNTDELAKNARELDMSASSLSAYNFAAEQSIGSNEGMLSSLQQLRLRLGEASRGTGSAIEALGILGISATDTEGRVRSASDVLLEAADALNQVDDVRRIDLADKLGILPLNLLLREGSGGIQALIDEAKMLGDITNEDTMAAEEFNNQWGRMLRVASITASNIGSKVLPVLTENLRVLQMWVMQNKELIQSGLTSFLETVIFLLKNFKAIVIVLLSLNLAGYLLKAVFAFKALGAAAFFANLKIFGIVLAIAAAIAAIGLIIEDFIVFKNGGDSAIGRLLERFPVLQKTIELVGEAIVYMRTKLTDFFVFISEIPDAITAAFTAVEKFVNGVINRISQSIANIKNSITDSIMDIKNLTSNILDFLPGFESEISVNQNGADPYRAAGALGASVNTSNTGNTKSVNIGTVTIPISGDNPEIIKNTVLSVLNGEIQQASNNAQSIIEN